MKHATRDAPLFRKLERALAASYTEVILTDGTLLAGVTPLYETANPPRYSIRIDERAPRDEILASLDRLYAKNAKRWSRARRARPGYQPQPAEFRRGILSFDQLNARTTLRREVRALVQAAAPKASRSRFRPRESELYHRATAYIAAERRAGHRDPTRRQIMRLLGLSEEQARRALEHARRLLRRYVATRQSVQDHKGACKRCKMGLPCRIRDRLVDELNKQEMAPAEVLATTEVAEVKALAAQYPAQDWETIGKAIMSLSDDDQRVLSLRYFEECSEEQAAAELQISGVTYRERLRSAEELLRRTARAMLKSAPRKEIASD